MSKSSIHEEKSSLEAAGTPDKGHATIKEAERHRDGVETEGQSEPQPQIHAKTFLALFAICLIYFSQTFALVGTGAVSKSPWTQDYTKTFRRMDTSVEKILTLAS